MFKRQKRILLVRKSLIYGLVISFFAAITCASIVAADGFSLKKADNAKMFFSSLLTSPGIIFDGDAVPVAQTVDENDLSSGYITQMPQETEIEELPPQKSGEIPSGMVPVLEAHYEQGTSAAYAKSGSATVQNCTEYSADFITSQMMRDLPFDIEVNSSEPQVLIMHTHATETYELGDVYFTDPNFSARTTDKSKNMIAVGKEIVEELNKAGINAIQSEVLNDYPSYNGSYAKSNEDVRKYLEKYPSIKVVLDIHRDAIQRSDGTRVKPVSMIGGMKAAQVMIICGADYNGNLPNFKYNLRFASRFQDAMESMYPGLTRPVLFDYRYYNQDLTTGSLLVEIGGHANSLEEAKYSGQLVGKALGKLLLNG